MPRRLLFATVFLIAGFAAGLVVTGRMNGVTSSFGDASRPNRLTRQRLSGATAA